MNKLVIIVCVLLAGCALPTTPVTVSATCDQEPMAEWILTCVANANPHSDEEPEDYVYQCERTAVKLFCGPSCYVDTTAHGDRFYRCEVP